MENIQNRKQRKLERFEDLFVWQKAHQLALEIYRTSQKFPSEERFGLISQMRRASVSVPANIAEGFKKHGNKDKINFYNIAQGSLEELRYYIILAKDLNYLTNTDNINNLIEEISKMLFRLISAVKQIKQ